MKYIYDDDVITGAGALAAEAVADAPVPVLSGFDTRENLLDLNSIFNLIKQRQWIANI